MQLKLLAEAFGVLKLPADAPLPAWALAARLLFLARTEDELSILCPQDAIPAAIDYSPNWRCLRAHGDLAFDEVGVVARLSKPLADAGLSLFLVSTHDRDYVFVRADDLRQALDIYRRGGFSVL